MSIQAMSWVIERSEQNGGDFIVLLMIANHAHSDGTGSFPSLSTLARESRMSRRNAIRCIARLERSGEVSVSREGPGANRYSLPAMHVRTPPVDGDKMSPAGSDTMSLGSDTMSLGSDTMSLGGGENMHVTRIVSPVTANGKILTVNEPSINRPPPPIPPKGGVLASPKKTQQRSKPQASPPFEVPGWIPIDAWADFVEMRTKIKKPLTRRAMELAVSKLGTLRDAGHDPSAVLNQSTLADWQGLFPISTHGGNGNGNRYDRTAGNKAACIEALRRAEERDRQADLRAQQGDE